jgi:hypothetical protein
MGTQTDDMASHSCTQCAYFTYFHDFNEFSDIFGHPVAFKNSLFEQFL